MSEYLPLCARWQDRQAVYDPAGLPVVWDRALLPLPVRIQLDPRQGALIDAVVEALRLWNREVGFTVFQVVPRPEDARVFVISGSATDGGLAATTHSGDALPESATVALRAIGSLSDAYGAAVHELGHVLGLADAPQGCMGPLPEDFDSSRHWLNPRAEEIDYLRAVYRRLR